MRLSVADAVAVGPRNSFGEIAVISQLQAGAGVRTPRGGILVRDIGEDGNYQPGDFNPERLILDDVLAATPIGQHRRRVRGRSGRRARLRLRELQALRDRQPRPRRQRPRPRGDRGAGLARPRGGDVQRREPQRQRPGREVRASSRTRSSTTSRRPTSSPSRRCRTTPARRTTAPSRRPAAGSGSSPRSSRPAARLRFRSIDPINNDDGGAPGANIRVGFLYRTDRGLEFVDRAGRGCRDRHRRRGDAERQGRAADRQPGPRPRRRARWRRRVRGHPQVARRRVPLARRDAVRGRQPLQQQGRRPAAVRPLPAAVPAHRVRVRRPGGRLAARAGAGGQRLRRRAHGGRRATRTSSSSATSTTSTSARRSAS